jgi:type I restriction enzyme R subunit
LKARLVANESLQASAKANPPESVRLLHDALFEAVMQTMIESNFEMFKRINDDEAFGKMIKDKIFELVYRDLLSSRSVN